MFCKEHKGIKNARNIAANFVPFRDPDERYRRHRDDAKCVWCCCVLCASYGREGIGAGEEKEAIYFMGGVINAVT